MKTKMHAVDLRYSRQELEDLFFVARQEDVEKGGRFDCRSAAINVWSHPWTDKQSKQASETIGTLYVYWAGENRIHEIEVDDGHTVDELLTVLGSLEAKGLGTVKHGTLA